MKPRPIAIVLALVLVCWVVSTAAQTIEKAEKVGSEGVYTAVIDGVIAKCDAKAPMLGSESGAIRRIAIRACIKSAFFRTYRDALVIRLMAENVSTHPVRIQYHLNRIFYQTIRPDDMPRHFMARGDNSQTH